jgi:toxin YoeB
LVKWTLVYTSQARRDAKKLARSGLKQQAERLLAILAKDPYQASPPYERLLGDLAGACSRRIDIQHRLVYQVLDDIKTVKILRMWTHYE